MVVRASGKAFAVRRSLLTLSKARGLCGSLTSNVTSGLISVRSRGLQTSLDSFAKIRRHLRGITHIHKISCVGSSGTAGMGSY